MQNGRSGRQKKLKANFFKARFTALWTKLHFLNLAMGISLKYMGGIVLS